MDNISYFIDLFPRYLSDLFGMLSETVKEKITEIRIRREKPIVFYIKNKAYFIEYSAVPTKYYNRQCVSVSSEDFDCLCDKLCSHSYHTNMSNLVKGFVTAKNGSRVGVCSTAVYKEGKLWSVKNISSINIRIAREYQGCSKKVIDITVRSRLPSIIVAGKPACGKTTFLRDYAKQLSSGYKGNYFKTVIVDERNEIAGGFDVGINTDVLSGFSKEEGIEIASRTLSPDLIICDEIGSVKEVDEIRKAFSNGVNFAVSLHLKGSRYIFQNVIFRELLETKQFDYLVYLNSYTDDFEIIDLREVKNEGSGNSDDNPFFILPWNNGS